MGNCRAFAHVHTNFRVFFFFFFLFFTQSAVRPLQFAFKTCFFFRSSSISSSRLKSGGLKQRFILMCWCWVFPRIQISFVKHSNILILNLIGIFLLHFNSFTINQLDYDRTAKQIINFTFSDWTLALVFNTQTLKLLRNYLLFFGHPQQTTMFVISFYGSFFCNSFDSFVLCSRLSQLCNQYESSKRSISLKL